MSYLNFPRLTFSGQFQADVSTVNNDTRHFDNDTFNSDFQKFSEKNQLNGWWNPVGTGIFRLNDCKITALLGPDGLAANDLALGCVLFAITGLLILQVHARQRVSTWPLVALGVWIPLLLALLCMP